MSNLNLVKELREKTGAGFLDCKEALSKNSDDIDNVQMMMMRLAGKLRCNVT